jgi:hypothetical protein
MIFPTDPVLGEDQNEMAKLASVAAPTALCHKPIHHGDTKARRKEKEEEMRSVS